MEAGTTMTGQSLCRYGIPRSEFAVEPKFLSNGKINILDEELKFLT